MLTATRQTIAYLAEKTKRRLVGCRGQRKCTHLAESFGIESRKRVLARDSDPCDLGRVRHLAQEPLGAAQGVPRLLRVLHLDAREVEDRAVAPKHLGNREVPVAHDGVVVASCQLRRVGLRPVVPVDPCHFARDQDPAFSERGRG